MIGQFRVFRNIYPCMINGRMPIDCTIHTFACISLFIQTLPTNPRLQHLNVHKSGIDNMAQAADEPGNREFFVLKPGGARTWTRRHKEVAYILRDDNDLGLGHPLDVE
ncbi:hypothetical protein ABKN59_003197 [Abortiporus biennis]